VRTFGCRTSRVIRFRRRQLTSTAHSGGVQHHNQFCCSCILPLPTTRRIRGLDFALGTGDNPRAQIAKLMLIACRLILSTSRHASFVATRRRCVWSVAAIAVVLSFITTIIPIANASLAKANAMACCVGKAAGHCDSGIASKKVPQHAHVPTVETTSTQPAAGTASASHTCPMDCGTCATASNRQQKRERTLILTNTFQGVSPTGSSHFDDHSSLISSSLSPGRLNPRGPPLSR
jgi:hypothetical protein